MGKTMTLKRITDEEISRAISLDGKPALRLRKIAQAQLEADLKAHNAVIREILKDLREFAKNEVQMRRFNKSQFEAALLYQLNICEQKCGGKDV